MKDNLKTFYAISVAFQLGFFIIILMGGSIYLGYSLDKVYNSSPIFLISGLIIGLILTIWGIYHMLIPLIKK